MNLTKIFSQSQTTEKDTRIDDQPAVLDEPKDHAVTGETADEPQRQRISEDRKEKFREPVVTKWRKLE